MPSQAYLYVGIVGSKPEDVPEAIRNQIDWVEFAQGGWAEGIAVEALPVVTWGGFSMPATFSIYADEEGDLPGFVCGIRLIARYRPALIDQDPTQSGYRATLPLDRLAAVVAQVEPVLPGCTVILTTEHS